MSDGATSTMVQSAGLMSTDIYNTYKGGPTHMKKHEQTDSLKSHKLAVLYTSAIIFGRYRVPDAVFSSINCRCICASEI